AIEETHRFRIVTVHHLVNHLHELLRADCFARVQAAVDPHYGFPLARERTSLLLGNPRREREPARDLLIEIDLLEVFARAYDGHVLAPSLGRWSDIFELHPIGLRGQLLPIGFEL